MTLALAMERATKEPPCVAGLKTFLSESRRRKLPEIPRLRSRFRYEGAVLAHVHLEEVNTMKQFHFRVAEKLGLTEEDWDSKRVYEMDVQDLEEAAIRKLERQRICAATVIQLYWRGFKMFAQAQAELEARRRAAKVVQNWWRKKRRFLLPILHRLRRKPALEEASTRLQAAVRGWRTRRNLQTQMELHSVVQRMSALQDNLRVEAGTLVVRQLRMHLARRSLADIIEEEEAERAAEAAREAMFQTLDLPDLVGATQTWSVGDYSRSQRSRAQTRELGGPMPRPRPWKQTQSSRRRNG